MAVKKKITAKKTGVPVHGLLKSKNLDLVNDLIASGEWSERKITDDGSVFLKRWR